MSPLWRIATYNVHRCVGTDGRRSEQRVAEVITSLGVDLVGLQELDLSRRAGGIDQSGVIAEHLGWHRFFHPALRREHEEYGDAILSRHPIEFRQAGELTAPPPAWCPESRGALWITADTPLGPVQVINTHLGLGWRERLIQARLLAGGSWLGRMGDVPAVVMGDFNSLPLAAGVRLLARRLRSPVDLRRALISLRTFPTRLPLLALDHVLPSRHFDLAGLRVHRSALAATASDHFPLVAALRLKESPPRATT